MKQIVLGTAGHIDHGKTALIRALTGIDTDRLKEEKERGITIELGFASLTLPSGLLMGIVDVPGHEKFVKHMVAGAWGIDVVALVVAADEGVMPQTREHLDICRLLNVKKGLVVITKVDLADEELIQLVEEDVREFVRGTFLEGEPIIRVSSLTGDGIDDLRKALEKLADETEERPANGLFRLPIDRVFVMKGFGTVVTGTMVSGRVHVGSMVQVLPSGHEAKVRGIQLHNRAVSEARAGQRAALSLQGLDKTMIRRGEVVCHPGTLQPTQVLDGELEHLESSPRPLRNRVQLRFHIGTSLVPARIILLDREALNPGEKCMVQLRLDAPVVALPQDRFVIRGSSAVQTLAGGVILNNHPLRHRRLDPAVVEDLVRLRDGELGDVITYHIRQSGYGGLSFSELWGRIGNASDEAIRQTLERLVQRKEIVAVGGDGTRYVHSGIYQALEEEALKCLEDFHRKSPMALGLSKEELKTKLPKSMGSRLFQMLLREMIGTGRVVLDGEKIRLSGHRISVKEEFLEQVEGAIRDGGLQPPSVRELVERFSVTAQGLKDHLELLVNRGALIRVKGDLYFHREAVLRLKRDLLDFIRANGEITTPQFKDLTRVSRKFAIPLLEYFDSIKATIRVGDKRILRGGSG
ncbi:MAG: selenocysteine-specific translation elongation factor [Deltaproteobacteria bacterium]|nr:selenocysteine-specific translation elongation factor [Deltaproteobacteria bacterium]